jgi:DNA-3-methyladenine glycosylase I
MDMYSQEIASFLAMTGLNFDHGSDKNFNLDQNILMATSEIKRCVWAGSDPLYIEYHDKEWGKTTHDDKTLFEFLILESAQAGLSWITILRRRDGYRKAFADFDVHKVAAFTDKDVERLLQDTGIIRNRLKILSAINNAKLFIDVQKEFGSFDKYLYSFMPDGKPIVNHTNTLPASTPISDAISKDMKKRGFKFFGTTICYAHMQATGMVNDHIEGCSFK